MGQITYGVLFGVEMDCPEMGEDEGWYTMIECYQRRPNADKSIPGLPSGESFDGIGFWCAVGASGIDGVPYLGAFTLDDFGSASEEYAAALNGAKEAWARFATWCAEPHEGIVGKGKWRRQWKTPAIKFPEPRLYLVETNVG